MRFHKGIVLFFILTSIVSMLLFALLKVRLDRDYFKMKYGAGWQIEGPTKTGRRYIK